MRTRVRVDVCGSGYFAAGTYAELIRDCGAGGVIMRGWRLTESGELEQDEELCAREDFEWLDQID